MGSFHVNREYGRYVELRVLQATISHEQVGNLVVV